MKTFQFKKNDKKRGAILAIAYLVIVFMICYFLFGGINGMADKVNSFGSAKAAGLIIGIIVLLPFFVLLRLIQPMVSVNIDTQKMTVAQKGKEVIVVPIGTIDKMELNVTNFNTLNIYDKLNNLLVHLQVPQQSNTLKQIADELSSSGFEKNKGSRRYFNTEIETLICKRK